jgi:hypothetical protein
MTCDEVAAAKADLVDEAAGGDPTGCSNDSDCTIARTGSFCGIRIVNKHAAKAIGAALESAEFQELTDESFAIGCPHVAGTCIRPPSGAACVQHECVALAP